MTNSIANQSNVASQIDWHAALAEHQRWMQTVAYSRLRDREAVDEVMQEVALAVALQAAPLTDASKVAPWLYRLVTRQVLLFRRKCGRQRKLIHRITEQAKGINETESDPLDWLMSDERRKIVRVAVDRLPQLDATVLLLKYTENWSYDQIAEHLGVSRSSVESRLHRARKRLRQELQALQVVEV